jgi:hypothetical protein
MLGFCTLLKSILHDEHVSVGAIMGTTASFFSGEICSFPVDISRLAAQNS